eukprot:TRINITY_DN3734_c0_g1_i1.p1 TRINITY_DN3734_c0_g1~~TRINITY_DN3734_c0_g1_i1.p1  ORF type:complete len:587 (+),score=163.56 TRINITY_DN3734_c0_g1_i1:83-1762(+)
MNEDESIISSMLPDVSLNTIQNALKRAKNEVSLAVDLILSGEVMEETNSDQGLEYDEDEQLAWAIRESQKTQSVQEETVMIVEKMKKPVEIPKEDETESNQREEEDDLEGEEDDDGMSVEEEEDYEGEEEQEEEEEEEEHMLQVKDQVKDLEIDVNQIKLLFGNDIVKTYNGVNMVRFNLDVSSIMSTKTRELMGLDIEGLHIVISVQFGPCYTLEFIPPGIKVQSFAGKNDTLHVETPLEHQLRNMLMAYLQRVWPTKSKINPYSRVLEDGFDQLLSYYALEKNLMDVDLAKRWLNVQHANRTELKKGCHPLLDLNSLSIEGLYRDGKTQLATAMVAHKKRSSPSDIIECILENGGQLNMTHETGSDVVMNRKCNFLLELLNYTIRRMATPGGHCISCDKSAEIMGHALNKTVDFPVICTRATCQFEYFSRQVFQSLPLEVCPTSIAEDIRFNQDVVDLMISMCVASATSARAANICLPFPPDFVKKGADPKMFSSIHDQKDLIQQGGTVDTTLMDLASLIKVLDRFPSVSDMDKHCDSEDKLTAPAGSIQLVRSFPY